MTLRLKWCHQWCRYDLVDQRDNCISLRWNVNRRGDRFEHCSKHLKFCLCNANHFDSIQIILLYQSNDTKYSFFGLQFGIDSYLNDKTGKRFGNNAQDFDFRIILHAWILESTIDNSFCNAFKHIFKKLNQHYNFFDDKKVYITSWNFNNN